jgi:esterase/lipase
VGNNSRNLTKSEAATGIIVAVKRWNRKRVCYRTMKKIRKMWLNLLIIALVLYAGFCVLLYLFQEKLIFFPEKLPISFQFSFNQDFEEINIKTKDNTVLNNVLFQADKSRGVIFYLHGNAGSINSWGEVAGTYTDMNYDVFMHDYRGYGKSEGRINSEGQLFQDAQAAYDYLKKSYDESEIIVLGYSLGTGLATKIASTNHPQMLILQAPFYSMTDLAKNLYPFLPTFIVKYRFHTNKYIQKCTMPVVIFHGDRDEIIYYNSSVKLKELMKKTDTLITLNGQGHNGMSNNARYLHELKQILMK